jgi:hypothetical protein
MCAGVLSDQSNKFKYAFSFVSKNRRRPLNLRAEKAEDMEMWVQALGKALALEENKGDAVRVSLCIARPAADRVSW